MLYVAYGSNLNIGQMKSRCPKAVPLGKAVLPEHSLVFRGVADVVYAPRSACPVGLWTITRDCLKALDRYEGYPRLYGRIDVPVVYNDGIVFAMTYQMTEREHISPPGMGYLKSIADGYRTFRLDTGYLQKAVQRSLTPTMLEDAEKMAG